MCVLPWHGMMLYPDGRVQHCAISREELGNIHESDLEHILGTQGDQIRSDMINNIRHSRCETCYRTEDLQPNSTAFTKISNRIWYIKVMKDHDLSSYNKTQYVGTKILDLRWRNTCNFACVYCGPDLSSRWAIELNDKTNRINESVFQKNKDYILNNLQGIKHVYLAGGEPLLIPENLELLERLKQDSPNATIRINTNLSNIKNRIFETLIQDFDVKWTISVDSIKDSYEYIRYPGKWGDFYNNLLYLKSLSQSIDFNMTWSLLNAYSIFEAIDLLEQLGFQDNTIVIQPVYDPKWLYINNLNDSVLLDLKTIIKQRFESAKSDFYRNSLTSMLTCIDTPWEKNIQLTHEKLEQINQRRNLNFTNTLTYLNI